MENNNICSFLLQPVCPLCTRFLALYTGTTRTVNQTVRVACYCGWEGEALFYVTFDKLFKGAEWARNNG